MSNTPIASREAALRIALAARTLNNLNVRALVEALADKCGLPITEDRLAQLTVEDLRALLAGDYADQSCHVGVDADTLKAAIRLLWGEGVAGSDFPPVQAYADGDMPGSLRVAIASNHNELLDGHFGSCERFLIYQVSPSEIRLVGVRSTLSTADAEDKNAARTTLAAAGPPMDCTPRIWQSLISSARAGVHPVKRPIGGEARDMLAELQGRLLAPPPWLAQIMGVPAHSLAKFEADMEEIEP